MNNPVYLDLVAANTLRKYNLTVTFFTSDLCVSRLCPFTRFDTKILYYFSHFLSISFAVTLVETVSNKIVSYFNSISTQFSIPDPYYIPQHNTRTKC